MAPEQQQLALMVRWMRATIRANSPRDVERWSVQDVIESFHTIPSSAKVEFATWAALMSGQAPAAAAPAAPAMVEVSEEEINEANDRFLESMKKDFPALKKRLDDEEAVAKANAA